MLILVEATKLRTADSLIGKYRFLMTAQSQPKFPEGIKSCQVSRRNSKAFNPSTPKLKKYILLTFSSEMYE